MKKCIDDKMDVGMDFGWLLDRFWMDFGRVWEAKLDLKSIENLYKIDMNIQEQTTTQNVQKKDPR